MTTASTHDSQVDLSEEGEVVYRDKGYFGVPAKGYDATMKRGNRAGPISVWERLRNVRISRKRAPIERTFAVPKRAFRAGHVMITTVPMVSEAALLLFCFNLMQMLTIANKRHRISTGQENDGKKRWRKGQREDRNLGYIA